MPTSTLTPTQQALVLQWRPLTIKLVNQHLDRHGRLRTSREDLDSAANEGLCVAASRFDPERGVLFITYACWWINYYIQTAGRAVLNVSKGDTARGGNKMDLRDDADVYAAGFGTVVRFDPTVAEDLDARRTWARSAESFGAFLAERRVEEAAQGGRRLRANTESIRAADHVRSAAVFLAAEFGESIAEAARTYGFSRERARQIYLRTRPYFAAWAESIRREGDLVEERQAA